MTRARQVAAHGWRGIQRLEESAGGDVFGAVLVKRIEEQVGVERNHRCSV